MKCRGEILRKSWSRGEMLRNLLRRGEMLRNFKNVKDKHWEIFYEI